MLLYFAMMTYPIFRLGTLINTAVYIEDGSSSTSNMSSISSKMNDVHYTLTPIWVGIAYGITSFVVLYIPIFVHLKPGSFFSYFIRVLFLFFFTLTLSSFFAMIVCLIWEIVNAIVPSAHGDRYHGNGAFISLMVLVGLIALRTALNLIQSIPIFKEHLTIESNKIKAPFTICHISDVHIGSRFQESLKRVVKLVESEDYDVLVITGDLFDMPCLDEHDLDPILKCKGPIYFVAGNHDLFVSKYLINLCLSHHCFFRVLQSH